MRAYKAAHFITYRNIKERLILKLVLWAYGIKHLHSDHKAYIVIVDDNFNWIKWGACLLALEDIGAEVLN